MLKDLIYEPIKADMIAVDTCIKEALLAEEMAPIRTVNEYILKAPGKRLRPALLLLVFRAISGQKASQEMSKAAISLASAVELIHMASLVHDDIIDHAPLRHNQATVHEKFGTETGIAMGVYLYAHSLSLIAHAGSLEALSVIGETVKALCQGELSQVMDRDNPNLSLDDYITVLKKKTGILFASACRCGAILSGADEKVKDALTHYGENLGFVFQVADDIMDLMGDADTLGKDPGQDFDLGEVTLPILYLLNDATNADEKAHIEQLILSKDESALLQIRQMVSNSQAPKKSLALALSALDDATSSLAVLDESAEKTSLSNIIEFTKQRALVF